MSRTDIKNSVSVVASLLPAAQAATIDGTGVDLTGYDAAVVVIEAGTTSGTFTFEVQESDDDATYAPVADADLDGTEPSITTANDNAVYEIGYHGIKRYVRVSITAAGTSLPCSAVVVRGKPRVKPA